MSKPQQAIAQLEFANPFQDGGDPGYWSQADEDKIFSFVFAQMAGISDGEAVRGVPSMRVGGGGSQTKRSALLASLAVAVGAVVLAVYLSSSGAPGAFGAWTARTTKPLTSQVTAANVSCQHSWPILLLPSAQARSISTSLSPLVLRDSRGPFEMLLYAGPSGEEVCLWNQGVIGVSGGSGESLPPTIPDSIGVPIVPYIGGRHPFVYAYGRAGAQVTAVTLILDNGKRVEATLQNGFYGAWWPSRTDVHSAMVTTPQEVFRQDFGSIGPND
jgi:hypothetical protein